MEACASPDQISIVRCSDALIGICSGGYYLRIRVSQDLEVAFGRYREGRALDVPFGEYVYVGSACGLHGDPLAKRLGRHATRSGSLPPHSLRPAIEAAFGLGSRVPWTFRDKKLHWHVDYLLDRREAELVGVLAVVTGSRVESRLRRLLRRDRSLLPLSPGLGAGDHSGSTHLLRATDGAGSWSHLESRVRSSLAG